MAEKRSLTVVTKHPPLVPPAVAGGLLGADLGLLIATLSQSYLPIMVFLIPTLFGAGVTALASYAIQSRRGALRRLNRDLLQIASMSERGLIDEDEYHRLKMRIIDEYQPRRLPARRIIKPALWGALISGFIISVFAGINELPGYLFLWALFGPSMAGSLLAAGGTALVHRLQQRDRQPELSPGEPTGWQPLGARQPLPPRE